MRNTAHLQSSPWWPYLIFAIGTLAGSTGPIFLRLALAEGVPSSIITVYRLCIASLVVTPLVLNRYRDDLRRLRRMDIFVALLTGVLFAGQITLIFESYVFTSVLIAGVIIGSIPLWTALIERFVLHMHVAQMVWVGLALALVGGVFIALSGAGNATDVGSNILLGAVLALSGAIMAAVYLVVGRSLRNHMSFIPFVWLVFTSAAFTSLLILPLTGAPLTGYSTEGYFWVLMTTIFPQIIAHGAFNYVLGFLPPTLISMAGQLTGVISAVAAFFIFAELPGPLQLIGSAIITVGVVIAIFGQTRH